jgi:sugar-specific transcriptional regulator TrmB
MLEQFGLSNYENKVYMALLKLGSADARTISTHSEVPYGRIYDVLDSLRTNKIIAEISGRPKKYTANEPVSAVNRLLNDKKLELSRLEKQAEIAVQELNKEYEGKPENELVWKVAIGEELYQTYFDLLEEARFEFLTYMEISEDSTHGMDYLEEYRRLFQKMTTHGVKIKLLLGITSFEIIEQLIVNVPTVMHMVSSVEIRYTDTFTYPFSIIDGEKVLLKVSNPADHNEMLAAVYLWQNSLAKVLKPKFNELWEQADPLKITLES